MKKCFSIILFINFLFCFIYSQTPLSGMRGIPLNLPDISIVGNFYSEISEESKNILNIQELELVFQGYIYPKLYSNIIFSYHKDEFEVEEAYLNFADIFSGLFLEVGKKFLDFGKINKIHPHHRTYFDQPEIISSYFGEHGLSVLGYRINYLLPLNFFAQIGLGLYDIPQQHHHNTDEEHHNHEFSLNDKGYFSKLWLSFPITSLSELEVGLNYIFSKGPHFEEHKDDINLYGLDLSYKYIISTYKTIKIQSEIFTLARSIPLGDYSRLGGYLYFGYGLSKYWSFGVRYDLVELPQVEDENNLEEKITKSSLSFIVTRNLTETTYLRTQYKYNIEDDEHIGYLQMVFGFGPHSHMLE